MNRAILVTADVRNVTGRVPLSLKGVPEGREGGALRSAPPLAVA